MARDRARPSRAAGTAALAAGALALLALGCARAAEPGGPVFQGPTMGTRFTVRVDDDGAERRRDEIAGLIRGELEAVDEAMSTYKAASEVSRLNAAAAGEPVPVSGPTFEVLSLAQRVSEDTGGAFDVTVGPLVDAWGFGPAGAVTRVPDDTQIAALLQTTGSRLLALDRAALTVTKGAAGVRVDLSAIAKGYAVDRVGEALERAGLGQFMVEVGGEIVVRGQTRRGSPWRIGIESPAGGIQRQIQLDGGAVATSGNYRNFYELDGREIAHTIDPRSGRPVGHRTASVAVIADTCALADALATALMVMGPDEGRAWADARDMAVLFLVDRQGQIEERPSAAFARLAAR